ncbi:aminotransferase class I/II-fold pyridoxal phosphate-dependent enzyme [Sinorhizobium medicae]|nr:aminotransferase class I/II-fold pyridoxal phosphate-dependent enzyme [Sinorhizobium medicae]
MITTTPESESGFARSERDNPSPRFGRRSEQISPSGTSMAQIAALSIDLDNSRIIDFTIGELGMPASDKLKLAAIDALNNGATRYTDTIGLPALRSFLATEFEKQTGQAWTLDEVALTGGAKSGLYYLGQLLLDVGDEVIIPRPHWQTFPTQIRLAGGHPILVDHDPDGQLDIANIRAALTDKTRAIIINTPNNPTGAVYSEESLRQVAEMAIAYDLWIIFDQCYRNFTYDEHRHHNILRVVPAVRDRTVIIDSFSKRLGIAGWRLGFLAAPKPVVAKIRAYQSHITSCPNVVAQRAVLAYLESGADDFDERAFLHLAANREVGLSILTGVRDVPAAVAQGGFYFYLDVHRLLGRRHHGVQYSSVDDLTAFLIAEARVATVPGTAFSDPTSIRICYAGCRSDLVAGLQRTVAALNMLS